MRKKKLSVSEHFNELKNRLLFVAACFFIFFFASYFFAEEIYGYSLRPLSLYFEKLGSNRNLIYTALTEVFFTYLALSFYCAFFAIIPICLFHIFKFIEPGLKKSEKRIIRNIFISAPILFYLGIILVYLFIFPAALEFFASFESKNIANNLSVQLEAKVSEYFSLLISLFFAFGIAFELPVILVTLAKFDIITANMLKKYRRGAIIASFIIGAILTPPDVFSQVFMASTLIILYEISILACNRVKNVRYKTNKRKS